MKRAVPLIAALLFPAAIGACGKAAPLRPAAGDGLPPVPYGAATPRTPEQLLTAPPEARPTRTDELLRASERRQPDEFALPPQ